jgi:antitoxin component of MazEF toxin-antitoxin module
MQTQTIFRAGNSNVIAIPSYILDDSNFKAGHKITLDKVDENTMVIKTITPSKQKKITADTAFKKWLDVFMKENGEILDELAER